jgi:hypothetical protein
MRKKNNYTFKIGDLIIQKNSKLGKISVVKDIGFPKQFMSISKYGVTINVYVEDYRLATEKDILQSKIKNVFINKDK